MLADCCAMDQLCDRCLGAMFAHIRGAAANRGERWATELATERQAPWMPWPIDSPKVREHAVQRVADLSRDARLRELLATEAIAYAAKCWNAADPG